LHHPHFVEAVRAGGYTGRSTGVGIVLDLMIHDIDLVLSLVRSDVVDIEAMGAAVIGPHEDLAHARLLFANGSVANLNASRLSYEPQRRMKVYAENAFADIDFASATTKIVRPSRRVLEGQIDFPALPPEEQQAFKDNFFTDILPLEELQVERRNAILDEQHDFVISILSQQTPQVTGSQGRDALAVAEEVVAQIHHSTRHPAHAAGNLQGPHWDLAGKSQAEAKRRAG
jgi:predicted dehydrogenase